MRRILRWPFPSAAEKLQAAAPGAAEAAGQAAALGALEARLRWNRVNAAPLDIRVGNFMCLDVLRCIRSFYSTLFYFGDRIPTWQAYYPVPSYQAGRRMALG